MQAVREIHTVKDGKVNIAVPEAFWNTEVEVIILPAKKKILNEAQDALYGCLSEYADETLRAKEDDAWGRAVEEKYRVD